MKIIKIGDKVIGKGKPCFIIAEAGVNHNGDLKIAKKLVDVAARAGADAVKFQTFKAEKLVTTYAKQAKYQTSNIGYEESQFEMLKRLELKEKFHLLLKKYVEDKGLIFMSTPFDEEAIDFLDNMGIEIFKAGSGELNNFPYLVKMAKKNKPMIISTGMATLKEVDEAVNFIKREENDKLVVLHCTSNYPCPYEEVNLRAMKTMEEKLGCLIGYSDHTMGITVAIMAIALGAVVIEKHFTLNRNLPGPDHKSSLEPDELKEMIRQIRIAEKALGNYNKKPTESEKKIMKLVRKSLVAKKNIEKGSIIDDEMIVIKRPGTGLSPNNLHKIKKKKAKRNISKDEIFQLDMVE